MDINHSRPIRITSSGSNQKVYASATKIAAVTARANNGDVYIALRDGAGGQILWEFQVDDATSSPPFSFGPYPLLFNNGVYADITEDIPGGFESLSVALVLPASAGT